MKEQTWKAGNAALKCIRRINDLGESLIRDNQAMLDSAKQKEIQAVRAAMEALKVSLVSAAVGRLIGSAKGDEVAS